MSDPLSLTLDPPLALTALATHCGDAADDATLAQAALAHMKSPKMKKFMGRQDLIAVLVAGRAVAAAGLDTARLAQRTGLYLAVGSIPFELDDVKAIAAHSVREGAFSCEAFAREGIEQVNPLLTFRCLPNMPAFHVSLNLGMQGSYFVTHPGAGQAWLALSRAARDLAAGRIDCALVGAVADQSNHLVDFRMRHQFGATGGLPNTGAMLCLERAADAAARGAPVLAQLTALDIRYTPHDPLDLATAQPVETLGAAAPWFALEAALAAEERAFEQQATCRDGITARATWRRA